MVVLRRTLATDIDKNLSSCHLHRQVHSVEPQYNEVPLNWQNVFIIMGNRYIKVLFHRFYYYWAEKYGSSYQGLCHIGIIISGFTVVGMLGHLLMVFFVSGY